MSAWSGFGDYVEKLGAPMTGAGDAANFEQMLEKALAAEAAAPPTTTYETTVCIIGGGVGGLAAAAALSDVGVACLVFERDASLEARRAGYGMTLSSDERGPLAHLKILQRCRELDCASTAHWVFAGDGSVLGYYGRGLAEVQECRDARSGSLRVQRQQLREVLLERVAPAAVHWNHQLARVDESDGTSSRRSRTAPCASAPRSWAATACGRACASCARPGYRLNREGPSRRSASEWWSACRRSATNLVEGRGFYVLDGRARLFTMPFSATLTMWQLSFGWGRSIWQSGTS